MNLDKGDDMKVFNAWWGSGLLTAPASKWKSQRKLLNHTFGHSVLLEFLEIFNKESILLNMKLGDFAINGETFNVIPYLTATTLNIICGEG
jgi:cytochrome P450 family 313